MPRLYNPLRRTSQWFRDLTEAIVPRPIAKLIRQGKLEEVAEAADLTLKSGPSSVASKQKKHHFVVLQKGMSETQLHVIYSLLLAKMIEAARSKDGLITIAHTEAAKVYHWGSSSQFLLTKHGRARIQLRHNQSPKDQ